MSLELQISKLYDENAEAAIIGAIIKNNKILDEVALGQFDLYFQKNRIIFSTMLEMKKGNIPIDTVSLCATLEASGNLEKASGAYYVSDIFNACPSSANFKVYEKIILDTSTRRKMIEIGNKIINNADFDPIAELEKLEIEQSHKPLEIKSWRDINNDLSPPRQNLIERGLFPRQSIFVIGGEPKAGKTGLAISLCCFLSRGKCWFGFPIPKPLNILYLLGEGGYDSLKEKLQNMTQNPENGTAGPFNVDFILDTANLNSKKERYQICRQILEREIDVLVIDPLVSFHDLDENSNSDMGKFFNGLREITSRTGCSIIIVHHTRKPGINETPGGNSLRGASAIFGAVDSVITVTPVKNSPGKIKLNFDLRHGPPVDSFFLERAGHWFITAVPDDIKAERNNQIIKLLSNAGNAGMLQIDLVLNIAEKFKVHKQTPNDWVNDLIQAGVIVHDQKKRNKRLFLAYKR